MLDHTQEFQEVLEITGKHIEKAVRWGMLLAFVVVVLGMVKGIYG